MISREVVVVIAVFRPDPQELEEQLASLSAQTGVRLRMLAVVADRVSGPLITELADRHGLEVELFVPETQSNSYESFGLGLEAALAAFPDALAFAFCDQDDVWDPDRMRLGVEALDPRNVSLVHSDARVIDGTGQEIAASLHRLERRTPPASLRDLLLANVVTGMTAVFTRDTADAALPFPKQAGVFFHHDLWIALIAFALGDMRLLAKPLVDYRQHDRNVVGAGLPPRPRHPIGGASWRRHWGGTYYVAAYLAKSLYLRMTELAATGLGDIDRRKLAALRPYLSERGLGGAHLTDAVRMAGRGRHDLAVHSAIFFLVRIARALLAARKAVRGSYLPALAEFDSRAFSNAPGVEPSAVRGSAPVQNRRVRHVAAFADPRISPSFRVRLSDTRQCGVLILVPSLNPGEIFAGIATAIDIAVGLAEQGHPVILAATDLPIGNPRATRAFVLSRSAAAQEADKRLRLVCGKTVGCLTLPRDCAVLATAWWSAHVANTIIDAAGLPRNRFFYLVQDYEPGFYPWGTEYAGALSSYDFGATPIFNCLGLRDYFLSQGLFADSDPGLVFHPSIDIARYASLKRSIRPLRRLAFYGRPEVSRNLFPTGLAALDRFLTETGVRPDEIELVSVGMAHEHVSLTGGHILRSLGKIPWSDYPRFLADTDVGLSLMLSPHPSHPPIEMAAAGARVVTNAFAGKDLSDLSPAIQSSDPTPEALSRALQGAWYSPPVANEERRIDLTDLGRPLREVVSALSERVSDSNIRQLRHA